MGPTTVFGTIHRFHYTISANFYFYLQYFQQKIFSLGKISRFQMDPKCPFGSSLKSQLISLFSSFLLLFIGNITLFSTSHGFHYTISANFYIYLQYFQ